MKKLFLLAVAFVFLSSCKKNFSCACKSINPAPTGGYINQTQYGVKEFNEQAAHEHCLKNYQESGKALGDDYTCEVMQ
jgi:hypothetical protein